MRIVELSIFRVSLALRKRVEHASSTRTASENIIVRCRLADGTEGWGEGVPRDYVTGETPAGAMEQLAATDVAAQLGRDCGSWAETIELCDAFQPAQAEDDPRGCRGNSLRCAVELSVLDAYGRLFGEPVRRVLDHLPAAEPIRAPCDRVRYSGAIATAKPIKLRMSALAMRAYGFAHCKLKVGMRGMDDAARVAAARRWMGPKMDIRLDANEAWSAAEAASRIEPLLKWNISSIEQPVPHEDVLTLADVRRHLPVLIMLDESLTGLADAERAIRDKICDLFNIRLSKCGGFLNSARLAARAAEAGLGYQLGCHPGESGILSAAGRHWATSIANIRYLEGSYDRHLVREPLTREDLTFSYGGWAPGLVGPGLGINVDAAAVDRLAIHRADYQIS